MSLSVQELFQTSDDAYSKLGCCVIKHKNNPLFIHSIVGNSKEFKIRTYDLPYTGNSPCKFYSGDLIVDHQTLGEHLGYCNLKIGPYIQAVYLQRMAVRKVLYGLHRYNVSCSDIINCPELSSNKRYLTNFETNVIGDPNFLNTWNGIYPNIQDIEKTFSVIQDNLNSIAFSKQFAINRKDVGPFFLEYRNRDIGWSEDFHKFALDKSFRYLAETLEHNGIIFK